ncbi:MAG: helix-turn-helix transcriptional regulator [Bacteroidia bacterium]|nr:helix-turn-helix transcriptional regulator [Bacteroidia bacterium]
MKKLSSKKLGQTIVKIRESKNISQSDLARLCMKDRQSIERVENGKTNPTISYLLDIAEALEVNLRDLTDFD